MSPLFRICPFLFLLMAPAVGAQGFSIAVSPAERVATVGDRVTFAITALPADGFGATVFLHVSSPTLSAASLDPQRINAPYSSGATLSISVTAADIGHHTIIIEGKNGDIVRYDTVTLRVMQGSGADQWIVYNTVNSALQTNRINSIVFDRTGTAWIGTDRGLMRAMPGEAPQLVNDAFSIGSVWAVAVDSANGVWAVSGTSDIPPKRYVNGEWIVQSVPEKFASARRSVYSITASPDGSIWFSTGDGLLRLKDENWELFSGVVWGGTAYDVMYRVVVTSTGDLWGLTSEIEPGQNGLVKFDGSYWTTYLMKDLGVSNIESVGRLVIGDSDRVWMLNRGTLVSASGPGLISRPAPFDAEEMGAGRDGRIWIGSGYSTSAAVLAAESGTSWNRHRLEGSGLPIDAQITSIAVHDNGSIWVSTWKHGLAILWPGISNVGMGTPDRHVSSDDFAVTPNPVATLATITVTTAGGTARVTLHDNLGSRIAVPFEGMIAPGAQSMPIDLSAVDSGVYLLRVEIDGKNVSSRMVVVAR